MRRSRFLASFFAMFGVAKAQQWRECVPDKSFDSGGSNLTVCSSETKTARANQCPVCGTMVDPYLRKTQDENGGFTRTCVDNPNSDPNDPSTWWVTCTPPKQVPIGPTERMARCKRCNAAFWQDAEEKR